MGGGDLNLKKSWHPHTMKNQEKVWKAEQAKSQEERKLSDLRKEIAEEKNREELKRIGEASGILAKTDGDKKLEWMYKNSNELINRDEYLLGRTIDKSFEVLQAEEQRSKDQNMVGVKKSVNHVEHEVIPFSIRAYRNMESTEQVDLQRKVMEDPLMLIKQREMESRRKILENPVKLKELHRILKTDQVLRKSKKSKKMKKAKKSKKKHRKHAKSSTDSSSSDSDTDGSKDLDKELAKRYERLKGSLLDKEENLADLNLTKLLDTKYETISKELDKAVESKKKLRKSRKRSASEESDYARRYASRRETADRGEKRTRKSRSPDFSSNSRYRDDRNYRRHSRERDDRNKRLNRSRSRSTERYQSHASRQREDRNRGGMMKRSRSPVEHHRRRRTPSKSHSPVHPTRKSSPAGGQTKKSLSEAEKEARRREMMENAAWRETDRTKAVQKHREAYAREEEQHKTRDFDKEFINKEVKKAIANQTSVGSRIRSNLNNIQRTSAAMNAKFTRK